MEYVLIVFKELNLFWISACRFKEKSNLFKNWIFSELALVDLKKNPTYSKTVQEVVEKKEGKDPYFVQCSPPHPKKNKNSKYMLKAKFWFS